jgi:RNA polymerase sigma-70 factor (ECF subfamily)
MIESTSEDPLSINLLVIRSQAGDEWAFARLYEVFGEKTLRYLAGLLGDDAPDVQQELWLSVYGGIRHVANPNAFRTWLFRATRHKAIDFLRKAKRETELMESVSIDQLEANDDSENKFPESDSDTDLFHALSTMPMQQREVVLLRYRDEMTYGEIAMVIGCPIGTVKTRLYYAKRRLRDLLKGDR